MYTVLYNPVKAKSDYKGYGGEGDNEQKEAKLSIPVKAESGRRLHNIPHWRSQVTLKRVSAFTALYVQYLRQLFTYLFDKKKDLKIYKNGCAKIQHRSPL